jgi:hypothetical protein
MTKKRTAENEIVMTSGAAAAQPRRKTPARARAKRTAEPPSTLAAGSEAADEQTAAQPVVVGAVAVAAVSPDQIAKLAYLYWEARGCQGGAPEEDWLRAERELLARA